MPFLHGGVVNEFQWLNERQFLDAVAVAMITPGPFVLGKRAIVDVPSAAIALGTLAGIVYVRRLPEPLVIVVAGVVGLLARTWIGEGT